jgi:Ca-dependent carbohydrate-binding module xylan-binding
VVSPAAVPAAVGVGRGPDDLVLSVAEDALGGNAQFTIAVDGSQIGGTQTASALNGTGSSQTFDVEGSFGPGQHTVSVDFLNDLYDGSPSMDRNLHVTGASIDGAAISSGKLTLMSSGTQSFSFQEPTATPDTLTLGVSEDAWVGNAEFTMSVDGKQTGGVMTTTALHSQAADGQQLSGIQSVTALNANGGSQAFSFQDGGWEP